MAPLVGLLATTTSWAKPDPIPPGCYRKGLPRPNSSNENVKFHWIRFKFKLKQKTIPHSSQQDPVLGAQELPVGAVHDAQVKGADGGGGEGGIAKFVTDAPRASPINQEIFFLWRPSAGDGG